MPEQMLLIDASQRPQLSAPLIAPCRIRITCVSRLAFVNHKLTKATHRISGNAMPSFSRLTIPDVPLVRTSTLTMSHLHLETYSHLPSPCPGAELTSIQGVSVMYALQSLAEVCSDYQFCAHFGLDADERRRLIAVVYCGEPLFRNSIPCVKK